MKAKAKRQAKILELVTENEIETQSELTNILARSGFDVTQATVSRDIHEMKMTKMPTARGYRYVMPTKHDQAGEARLKRIFWDSFVSMDYAGNMLVIRTFNGMAMAVGASLDGMYLPEIVGCIAGDDVVMCATKSEKAAINLMDKLKRVMQ